MTTGSEHRDQSSTSSGPYRPTETSRLVSKDQECHFCEDVDCNCKDGCPTCDYCMRREPKEQGLPSEVGTKGLTDQQTGQSPAITSFSAPESSMGAGEAPDDYIEPTEPAIERAVQRVTSPEFQLAMLRTKYDEQSRETAEVVERLREVVAEANRYKAALRTIRDLDYRGSREQGSIIAYRTLDEGADYGK